MARPSSTYIEPAARYEQFGVGTDAYAEETPTREETKYSYVAPNRVERMLDAKAGFDNPYIRYNAVYGR